MHIEHISLIYKELWKVIILTGLQFPSLKNISMDNFSTPLEHLAKLEPKIIASPDDAHIKLHAYSFARKTSYKKHAKHY